MPFGNRTGPEGKGPITGRGAGYCSGFGRSGFANPVARRHWLGLGWRGWGGGGGRRPGRRYYTHHDYPWW